MNQLYVSNPDLNDFEMLDRYEFYERAKKAYAIWQWAKWQGMQILFWKKELFDSLSESKAILGFGMSL